MKNRIIEALAYAHEHGKEQDEITCWEWRYEKPSAQDSSGGA